MWSAPTDTSDFYIWLHIFCSVQSVPRWNSSPQPRPSAAPRPVRPLMLQPFLSSPLLAPCCESEPQTLVNWAEDFVWPAAKTEFRPQWNNEASAIFTAAQSHLMALSSISLTASQEKEFKKKHTNYELFWSTFVNQISSLLIFLQHQSPHKFEAVLNQNLRCFINALSARC